jgi:hypothetical protein
MADRSHIEKIEPLLSTTHHHSSSTTYQCLPHHLGPQKTTGLSSCGNKSTLMISVTLMFEAFDHVAKSHVLIMGHFLGNYIFFFISPWLLE